MSHITTTKLTISKDKLCCLRRAAQRFGGLWMKKDRYTWYGRHMGDYPIPAGMSKEQLGHCEYAIGLPGTNYEVGVFRKDDGTYGLAYDFWGPGRRLREAFGDELCNLAAEYQHEVAAQVAQEQGMEWYRVGSTEEAEQVNEQLGLYGEEAVQYQGKLMTILQGE